VRSEDVACASERNVSQQVRRARNLNIKSGRDSIIEIEESGGITKKMREKHRKRPWEEW